MLELVTALEEQGLPFPLSQCSACGETLFKQGHWIQCPDCGALSTAYGGSYRSTASSNWKAYCDASKSFIKQYKENNETSTPTITRTLHR